MAKKKLYAMALALWVSVPLISPEMYSSSKSYSEKAFLDSGMLFKN